jgi:putative tricarboxylic transport membrane protein
VPALRRSGYSVAGIVLGLILGKIGEQSFAQAMQMIYYDPFEYLNRPIGLVLLLCGVGTIAANVYTAVRGHEFYLDEEHKDVARDH